MRNSRVTLFLVTAAALLLASAGIAVLFITSLSFSPEIIYALNPGAILADWIWPGGVHSGLPLAAFSGWFVIVADYIVVGDSIYRCSGFAVYLFAFR